LYLKTLTRRIFEEITTHVVIFYFISDSTSVHDMSSSSRHRHVLEDGIPDVIHQPTLSPKVGSVVATIMLRLYILWRF